IKHHLSKLFCSKCGCSLNSAKLVPIGEFPLAIVAHAVCDKCKAESMVTITSLGAGAIPMKSDLTSREVKKSAQAPSVSLDDVLDLHKRLKKKSVWNLLHKKEKNLVKKPRN